MNRLQRWWAGIQRKAITDYTDIIASLMTTNAGVAVDEQSALRFSTVWSCVRLISEDCSTLPLILYERLERGKRRVREHPLYRILHDQPNPEMSAQQFRETLTAHVLTWGNGYAFIVRDGTGRVRELWPLLPDRTKPRRDERTRELFYETRHPRTDEMRRLHPFDVFHVAGLGYDGVCGYSPVAMHRQAIGLGLAAEEFGARFFGQGTNMGGFLEFPNALGEQPYQRLKKEINELYQGLRKTHQWTILDQGGKATRLTVPPDEAQFIECLAPGTMVTMANGMRLPAESLKAGDDVMGWDGGPISARVNAVEIVGPKPLVIITTARGRTLTVSYDHPCLALRRLRTPGGRPASPRTEWIRAEDLEPGHYVRIGLGAIATESTVSFETAWFLGAMVGDGYIRSGGCSMAARTPAVVEAVRGVVTQYGGSVIARGENWDLKTGGAGRRGSPLRTLLNASGLVGCHAHTKRVPGLVLRGGPDAWRGFLSGYLDTDGHVRIAEQPYIYWSSVNHALLEDCQHLLALLDIQSGLYRMSDEGPRTIQGRRSYARRLWGLYVCSASQIRKCALALQPTHKEKQARLRTLLQLSKSRYREENFLYDRVVSVETLPPGPVIAIEVDRVHTHVTNGIVTHNTRKFTRTEIASIYRVPPHKIGDLERASFANIEQQDTDYYKSTLRPWLVRWEQAIWMKLLSRAEQDTFFAEHLPDAILRGDTLSRYQAYVLGRNGGWLSINDIREKENMDLVEDGDALLEPLNMKPLGALDRVPPNGQGRSRIKEPANA